MNNNKLKLVDFSKGIKDTDIQYNFNALLNQLEQERISVSGSGISYGLDFELKGFDLTIKEGFLIDNKGGQVFIDETNLIIEKPILIYNEETMKTVDSNNRVYLQEVPYSLSRESISEHGDKSNYGITVSMSNMSGSSAVIPVSSIDGKCLNLGMNANSTNRKVNVSYYYASKRRDIIYIDNEYKIQYRVGITSPSPSIPKLEESEYIYILGYIEIDHNYLFNNKIIAKASVIKEFRSNRNVYTDSENNLYLCGTPFDSIKIIHTSEPKSPEVNTFWYDETTNELKIWRRTDLYEFANSFVFTSSDPSHPKKFETNINYLYGQNQLSIYLNGAKLNDSLFEEGSDLNDIQKQEDVIYSKEFKILADLAVGDKVSYIINRFDGFEEWVALNNKNIVNCEERHIWTPEFLENEKVDFEHDYQTFLFDAKTNRNMLYAPNTNALEILINQMPLHSDQFSEITIYDAISGDNFESLKHKLVNYYNYTGSFDPEDIKDEFENTGIGFKLGAMLNKESYVEARVTHRVNSNPISKRFQRNASYVEEGSNIYSEYTKNEYGEILKQDPIFETKVPFRYQENQIEVFLNGILLERNVDYIELAGDEDIKGSSINRIKILEATGIRNNDKVYYRITTSFYSYDHVDGLISGFTRRLEDMEDKVIDTLDKVEQKNDYIDKQIGVIETKIAELNNIDGNLNNKYMAKNAIIDEKNLSSTLLKGIAAGAFNKVYSVTTVPQSIDVTGVFNNEDFILIYNTSTGNILIKDNDFSITVEHEVTKLNIIAQSAKNCAIYATGIKFNRGL